MNNNDLFQASRRRFLAQLGGLTVAGMLGGHSYRVALGGYPRDGEGWSLCGGKTVRTG